MVKNGGIYYINDYFAKKDIITDINSKFSNYIDISGIFNTDEFVKDFIRSLDEEFHLTDDQMKGITGLTDFLTNDEKIYGLFGYAGTGKTSIIILYIYYLLNKDYVKSIAISAPTNIAVDILKSKFIDLYEIDLRDAATTMANTIDDIIAYYEKKGKKITFATVHKIIGMRSDISVDGKIEFIKGDNLHFKRYNIIIIDECSMLPTDIVEKILEDVKRFSAKFNVKVIFLGDPAQLPPVNLENGLNESIVFNKKLPKSALLYDEKIKMLDFKRVTMTNIVRTNDQTIINLCNEFRRWISNEISKPALRNFRGSKIKYYNYGDGDKISTSWFRKFLSYKKDKNKRNIILTWTNQQTNSYNIAARLALNVSPEEYEVGDCLIMNTFYNLQPIGQIDIDERNNEIVYTSEQIIISKVCKISYNIARFSIDEEKLTEVLTGKLGEGSIKKYRDTVDQLNKKMIKTIPVWKLYVLRHKKDIPSGFMYVPLKSDHNIINDNKEIVEKLIRKLSEYYDNSLDNTFDIAAEHIIKPLWLEYNKIFIQPFGNVSYGNSVTSHKAQGSNFNNVFIDAHDILLNSNTPESRKCLYTAITRVSDEIHMLL